MRKLILIAHTSLDGFVAGTKGELDDFQGAAESLDFVNKICETADAALFGRISYKLLNDYWPDAAKHPGVTTSEVSYSNWYNGATKFVVSKTMKQPDSGNTVVINNHVIDEIKKIKSQTGNDIVIFGSPSVSQLLMQQNLIDIYWIFINAIIFGKGIPLFKGTLDKIKLKLFETREFPNAEFALGFEAVR